MIQEDITEAKLAREQSMLLNASLEAATVGFLITDARQHDNPIVYANNGFVTLTGYELDDLVGLNCRFLQGPDTNPRTVIEIREALQQGRPYQGHILNYRKNGDPFWNLLRIAPVYNQQQELTHYVSNSSDITELRHSLDQLHSYEQIVSTSHDFLSLVDDSYRFRVLNDTYRQYFKKVPQTLIGHHVSKLYDKVFFERKLKPQMDRCLAGAQVNFEFSYVFPDIGRRYLEVNYKPLVDANDIVRGFYVVKHDITERKRNENLVRQSRKRVRKLAERLHIVREEERTSIAREIHDELGQRLTSLKMDLSWLSERFPKHWKVLPERVVEMASFVDSTLTITHKLVRQLRPPILDDLGLEAAVETESREFCERGGYNSDIDIDASPLSMDQERDLVVFRILQEALTNIARHAKATEIEVKFGKARKNLLLTIRDNGIGIQKHKLTSSSSLGLIGMRERAGVYGGRVAIEKYRSGGTLVRLTMPISGRKV